MKRFSVVLVVFYLLYASSADAKTFNYVFSGQDIYESCTHAVKGLDKSGEYDDHRFGQCAGYIAGIVDFHTIATKVEAMTEDMYCPPMDLTTAQVIREVTKYLGEHQERLHDLAGYLVIMALREAYPCLENGNQQ
jgi:hypothetical protein